MTQLYPQSQSPSWGAQLLIWVAYFWRTHTCKYWSPNQWQRWRNLHNLLGCFQALHIPALLALTGSVTWCHSFSLRVDPKISNTHLHIIKVRKKMLNAWGIYGSHYVQDLWETGAEKNKFIVKIFLLTSSVMYTWLPIGEQSTTEPSLYTLLTTYHIWQIMIWTENCCLGYLCWEYSMTSGKNDSYGRTLLV